jgi:acyl carrier protein
MNREETRVALKRVFEDVFAENAFDFSDSLSRETLEAWDSLGHIRLISATEEAFDIRFTIEEIEKLTSVGQMLERIAART